MKMLGAWLMTWGTIAMTIGLVGLRLEVLGFIDELNKAVGPRFKAILTAFGASIRDNDDPASMD